MTADIHALYYRTCGHLIAASADRAALDTTAGKVTGVAVRVATDKDLLALMGPRPRRCLCRVRDRSVLEAWAKAVSR